MIRVSMGPIRIIKETTDRWGQPVKYWQVNPWGYIDVRDFTMLIWFEERHVSNSVLLTQSLTEILQKKLKFSFGNTLHQFNALKDFKTNDYVRMVAVLDNPDKRSRIQYVPWFDAYIKYPIYELVCKLANKRGG